MVRYKRLATLCLAYGLCGMVSAQNEPRHVSKELFDSLEELSRLVDIAYCVGTSGVQQPFQCLSHCVEFPNLELVTVSASSCSSNTRENAHPLRHGTRGSFSPTHVATLPYPIHLDLSASLLHSAEPTLSLTRSSISLRIRSPMFHTPEMKIKTATRMKQLMHSTRQPNVRIAPCMPAS